MLVVECVCVNVKCVLGLAKADGCKLDLDYLVVGGHDKNLKLALWVLKE